MKWFLGAACACVAYFCVPIPTRIITETTSTQIGRRVTPKYALSIFWPRLLGTLGVTRKSGLQPFVDFLILLRNEMHSGQTITSALSNALPLRNSAEIVTVRDIEQLSELLERYFNYVPIALRENLVFAITSSMRHGVALTDSLDTLIVSMRHRVSLSHNMRSELSSTRSSIIVLACLPVLGAVMSCAVGSNSLQWLLSTNFGHICMMLALFLEGVGLVWVRLLMKSVDIAI